MMNLDFRSKFVMTLGIATMGISGYAVYAYPVLLYIMYAVAFYFLFIIGKYQKIINSAIVLALSLVAIHFIQKLEVGFLSFVVFILSLIVLRLMPGLLMGYYALSSTPMSDLIQSLNLMKLPDSVKIPTSVIFRFFYSISEDYRNINDAMKMHGLSIWNIFTQPVRIVEYKMVPLLMCSVRSADDVSVAAITRGLQIGQERTSLSTTHLKLIDYVLIVLGFGCMALEIWCKLC